ncbi:MAG: nuclear transport factor 2 family protein [Alphaproteobacteria bacterium]|nr:nuclear transport factor 2 family protein [Alphaproteobacteria bacterium]
MVDDFAARLRALEDREAIRTLIASYGPLADSGDATGAAALWADEGSYAVGGMAEARGRDAIAALLDGAMHRQLMADGCAHLLGPVMLQLDGDVAVAYGHSVVFRRVGEAFEVHRVSANRWQMVRKGESWCVLKRDNQVLDGSEAARALLNLPPDRRPR